MIKNLQTSMLLLLLVSLIATILLLLAIKIIRKIYIQRAKNEVEKIKNKEQLIFYKVGDCIEDNLYDLGKCRLIIKGFDAVCDTLRRHWNHDDNLKLTYMIKGESSIDVKLFFDNNGVWKQIEGLYNLSDGINCLNTYEIIFNENEKIKSFLETLIVCDIALWLGVISSSCIYL